MREKFKSWLLNDQLFYGLVIILVGIGSFGLGRASVPETMENEPIIQIIEPITLTSNVINATQPSTVTNTSIPLSDNKKQGQFLASKNGTKYYLPSCSGAKRIKPENIIYFSTREAAESAGYSKATNCAGL